MFVVATKKVRQDNFGDSLVGGFLYYTTAFFASDPAPIPMNLPLATTPGSSTARVFWVAANPVQINGDSQIALLLDDLMTIQIYSVRALLQPLATMDPTGNYPPVYPLAQYVVSNYGWSSISYDLQGTLYGVVPAVAAGVTEGSIVYRFDGITNPPNPASGGMRITAVPIFTLSFTGEQNYEEPVVDNATVYCTNANLSSMTASSSGSSVIPAVQSFGPYFIQFTQIVFAPSGDIYVVGMYPFYALSNRTPCCAFCACDVNETMGYDCMFASPCFYSTSGPTEIDTKKKAFPFALSKNNGLYALTGVDPSVFAAQIPSLSAAPSFPNDTAQLNLIPMNPNSFRNSFLLTQTLPAIPQALAVSTTMAIMLNTNLKFMALL